MKFTLTLPIVIFFLFFSKNLNAQLWEDGHKILPTYRHSVMRFGFATAVHGNTLAVGADRDGYDENNENYIYQAGAVYLYEFNADGQWIEQQKLVAADRKRNVEFGHSIAISQNVLAVGSVDEYHNLQNTDSLRRAGAVYIFEKSSAGTWEEVQKIVANDRDSTDIFGFSLAVSDDFIIVGAFSENEDENGENTMEGSGSAYIFQRMATGEWVQSQKIVASDRAEDSEFGYAISMDDNRAIITAPRERKDINGLNDLAIAGAAYVFEKNQDDIWEEVQKVVASDRAYVGAFGRTVVMKNNVALIGTTSEGRDENQLNEMEGAGAVYILNHEETEGWQEVQKIVPIDRNPGDMFGVSIDLREDLALIGAMRADDDRFEVNYLNQAGCAYIFKQRPNGMWEQQRKLVAPDRAENDLFGNAVALHENSAIVAAYLEAEDAAGENTLIRAGSVYIFDEFIKPVATDAAVKNDFVHIFPNPFDNQLTINFQTSQKNIQVTLFDSYGRKWESKFLDNIKQYSLKTSLPTGFYYLQIEQNGQRVHYVKIQKI